MGSDDWAVPSADAWIKSDIAHSVHFKASNCGFDGSIESLVVSWLHFLMLGAKSYGNDDDYPTLLHAMNGYFD